MRGLAGGYRRWHNIEKESGAMPQLFAFQQLIAENILPGCNCL